MIWYVGLTDNPDQSKAHHCNPTDWRQTRFESEAEALAWEQCFARNVEGKRRSASEGWRYGYWFTIARHTRQ
jgi:hypothetical protein